MYIHNKYTGYPLHWLPVAARIKIKVLMCAYKTTTGTAPIYLNSLVQTYAPSRSLRSASERRLVVPSQRGTKSLSRTFSWTVPSWWNDLPISIRTAESIFKKQLKTHFSAAPDQLLLTLTYSILLYPIKKQQQPSNLNCARLTETCMTLVYCCSFDGLISSIILLICTLLWIKASAKGLNVNVYKIHTYSTYLKNIYM